jgi:DNA-binding NarL/FixJ family response regulator
MADVPEEPDRGGDRTAMRVIIADDDSYARRTIRDVLQQGGIVVVADAHDGREAVELCLHYRPDIVLMDLLMPVFDGIAATRRIVKEMPDQVVVILTTADEEELGLLALRAGASGFLTKDVDIEALPQAIRSIHAGEAAISRRMGARLVEELHHTAEAMTGMRPVKSPLTAREWEVIDLLYEGKTISDIAEALILSRETVRSHVKNIRRKLNARSRQEAVAVAQHMRSGMARQGPGG